MFILPLLGQNKLIPILILIMIYPIRYCLINFLNDSSELLKSWFHDDVVLPASAASQDAEFSQSDHLGRAAAESHQEQIHQHPAMCVVHHFFGYIFTRFISCTFLIVKVFIVDLLVCFNRKFHFHVWSAHYYLLRLYIWTISPWFYL